MTLRYQRNGVRNRKQSVPQRGWRPRTPADVLPDLPTAIGKRSGRDRCGVVGLEKGDCPQPRFQRKPLCYYHLKVAKGLLEATAELYPVWPIPRTGYVITEGVTYRKVS